MKIVRVAILLGGMASLISANSMSFVEDSGKGTLTIKDGTDAVLTYRFGDQLKEGVGSEYTRSCYIHPLYSLENLVLTEDFPKDHFHHHGLFWTWPVIRTRGQVTQTWHPANLRQYFVRWLQQDEENGKAVLSVENAWKLDEKEIVAKETVTLHVHPRSPLGRTIDVEIVLQAMGGLLELQGAPEGNKGYGGLCFRGAADFSGAVITTDKGVLNKDSTNEPFRWADLSTEDQGVAIFVAPYHPDFPTTWLIRNSYAGVLNASWPGLDPVVLNEGEPVTLSYRVYIHKGDAVEGDVSAVYDRYLVDCMKEK